MIYVIVGLIAGFSFLLGVFGAFSIIPYVLAQFDETQTAQLNVRVDRIRDRKQVREA